MSSLHHGRLQRLWLLPLLGWALSGQAQERLTADQAVAKALSQTAVQDELAADIAVARSEVIAARTWANPTLAADREELRDGPLGAGSETSLVLSQPFELGGRRGLRIRAAEQGVAAAEAGVAHSRMQLRADVLRDYYSVVAAEQRAQAQRRIAEGLRGLASVADNRHRAGDLSGYESRRIAQAQMQAQARSEQAQAQAASARRRLAGWIGDAAMRAVFDPALVVPNVAGASADAHSTELDALAARRLHAQAQAQAANRPAIPLTVGVGTKRIRESGMSDDALIIQLALPLPIFDRNQGERARADAEVQRADAQYQRALQQTRARRLAARDAATRLAESARQLQRDAVPEAERLTAIARNSFAEGELDLVGLLDAYDAESAVIEQALDQQDKALEALLELERLSPATSFHQP